MALTSEGSVLVTQGSGFPTYQVGANNHQQQPSVCSRSFVPKNGTSGVYQQILDKESQDLCSLIPPADDPNWFLAFDQSTRSPMFSTSIPLGDQDKLDKGYDSIRNSHCAQMDWLRRRNVPFNDLCSGTLFSSGYNFSEPTISSVDVIPYCGIEQGLLCQSMIGNRATTNDTTETEQDCSLAAWNAACLSYGKSEKFFNPNKSDLSYNQEALGLIPYWCACSCFHSCNSSF